MANCSQVNQFVLLDPAKRSIVIKDYPSDVIISYAHDKCDCKVDYGTFECKEENVDTELTKFVSMLQERQKIFADLYVSYKALSNVYYKNCSSVNVLYSQWKKAGTSLKECNSTLISVCQANKIFEEECTKCNDHNSTALNFASISTQCNTAAQECNKIIEECNIIIGKHNEGTSLY